MPIGPIDTKNKLWGKQSTNAKQSSSLCYHYGRLNFFHGPDNHNFMHCWLQLGENVRKSMLVTDGYQITSFYSYNFQNANSKPKTELFKDLKAMQEDIS